MFLIVLLGERKDDKVYTFSFSLDTVFDKFNNNQELCDTELAYTLIDDIDFLLDLKEGETVQYFSDRAKEFPCLLKRTN
jgi:hypothetical protein